MAGVMRDSLLPRGVPHPATESTSTYCKCAFYPLEEVMEVRLLNARQIKVLPKQKTDLHDAEWIAQMLEHGLLWPSFAPPPDICRLPMLTPYRVQLLANGTRK